MKRPITTTTHGMIDYVTVGTLATLPRIFRWGPGLTNILTGAASGILGYSLITDYELSLAKVLPMKTHLALDGASALLTGAAPFLMKEPKQSAKFALIGIALFELTVSALTKPAPTAKSRIARLLGRRISLPAAAKVGWPIGKQARLSTIAKAAAFIGGRS
jgi:hypothetical protein